MFLLKIVNESHNWDAKLPYPQQMVNRTCILHNFPGQSSQARIQNTSKYRDNAETFKIHLSFKN
jgi:hypothetical protein